MSEDGSLRVCAALNQTTSRKVIVRLATVESATPNSDSNQAKGTLHYGNMLYKSLKQECGIEMMIMSKNTPVKDLSYPDY